MNRRRLSSAAAIAVAVFGGCAPISDAEMAGQRAEGLECSLMGDALRVEAVLRNTGDEAIEFYVAGTPWEPMAQAFRVTSAAGESLDPAIWGFSPPESIILAPGASARAGRDLGGWDLDAGETYHVELGTELVYFREQRRTVGRRLDCGSLTVVAPALAVVEAELSTDEGCTDSEQALMDPAYPLVLSSMRIARRLVFTGSPLFHRWFGPSGVNETASINCARGYLDQILNDYTEQEFKCHNICCETSGGLGCMWNNPFDGGQVTSLCAPLLTNPGPRLVDAFAPQSIAGTMVHELTHAVGTSDASHTVCGGSCNDATRALALAQLPRSETQLCDYVGASVWLSINAAENYERFAQDALTTTVAVLSAI